MRLVLLCALATAACATPSSRDLEGSWRVTRFDQNFPIEAEQAQVMTTVVSAATVDIANDTVTWRLGRDATPAGTLRREGDGLAVRGAGGEGLFRDVRIARRPDGRLEVRSRGTAPYTMLLEPPAAAQGKITTCLSADQRTLAQRAACEVGERRVVTASGT